MHQKVFCGGMPDDGHGKLFPLLKRFRLFAAS